MNGWHIVQRMGPVLVLAVMASGCTAKLKQRVAMLEGVNQNLTERLNVAHAELGQVHNDRENLNGQLLAAQQDADALRVQLAEMPTPQETAPGWTAVPGGAMIAIEGSVLFISGDATLRDEARRTLDAIVSTVQGEYADMDILVFGHTDDQPIKKSGWKDNYELSAERALAVVRYLRDRGVAPARLVASGCGEHRPRASGKTAPDRAANRRVEIFAIDPQLRTGRP